MKQFLATVYLLFKGLPMVLILVAFLVACSKNKLDLAKAQITTCQIDSLNALISEQTHAEIEIGKQADSLFKLSLALGYEKGIAVSASQKIQLLRKDYQYDIALRFIAEYLELLNQFEDPSYRAMVSEEIGLLYFDLDDFDQAYYYLTLALTYYDENNKLKKKSYILSRIGLIFKDNDKEKSMDYLKQSIDISIEINDSLGIARDLNNIAIIYQRQKIFDTAQEYYRQAMLINEKIGNWNYYATNLLNLANIEKDNENFEESIKLYVQSMQSFDTLNERYKYAQVLLHLGDVYHSMKDYEKAIANFTAAWIFQ